MEKRFLKHIDLSNNTAFITPETLNTLCIDKMPSPKQSFNSVTKYGLVARDVKARYGLMLGFVSTVSVVPLISHFLIDGGGLDALRLSPPSLYFVGFARFSQGYNRFANVANGTYAITTTPDPEELLDEENNMLYTPE